MTDRPPALDEMLIRTAPRALPHLSEFADKLLSTVSESGTVIPLDTGRILFSQGDPGDRLYTVPQDSFVSTSGSRTAARSSCGGRVLESLSASWRSSMAARVTKPPRH